MKKDVVPTLRISKKLHITILILCVIAFALRVFIALKPLPVLDDHLLVDDSYICFDIANNISHGNGPVSGSTVSNGFQPLYVFIISPLFSLFENDKVIPIHISLIILALFNIMAMYILALYTALITKKGYSVLFFCILWALHPYILENTLNGLETAVSTFFVALTLFYYTFKYNSQAVGFRSSVLLGVFIGLSMLARIDSALLSILIACHYLFFTKENNYGERIKNLLIVSFSAFCIMLPWWVYSYTITGDIFQISGKAVRYMSMMAAEERGEMIQHRIDMVVYALRVLLLKTWGLFTLCSFLAVVWFISLKNKTEGIKDYISHYGIITSLFLVSFIAYTMYVFGYWFFERYLFIWAIFLTLSTAYFVDRIPFSSKIVHYSLLFCSIAVCLIQKDFYRFVNGYDRNKGGYMDIGLWAGKTFPKGTVIGSPQSSALGYFADNMTVVNLDGVVNKECYDSLRAKNIMPYIMKRKIEYVLGASHNISFLLDTSKPYDRKAFSINDTIHEFQSWGNTWLVYKVNGNNKP